VQNLCKSAIWLNNGRIEQIGTAKSVSEAYLHYTQQEICGDEVMLTSIAHTATSDEESNKPPFPDTESPPAVDYGAVASVQDNIDAARGWRTGKAEIISVTLTRLTPGPESVFEGGERVRMTLRAKAHQPLQNPILGFVVRDRLGQDLFGENTLPFTNRRPTPIGAGTTFEGAFEFCLPMLPNGPHSVMASVADGDLAENVQHHWMHDAMIINVSSSKVRYGLTGIPFERIKLEIVNE
jgi:lipopolysaccharide transport system ATP-binding protein